jgi:cytoskeleton protein RodZ
MSDVTPPPAGPGSAGALLRAARQARGLEIDALAQVLKVPERKLAALEADRYDELPGLAFVRSLAQSYARQVGLDTGRVLALLPQTNTPPQQLENVSRGLQTPYREGSGGTTFGRSWAGLPEWLNPIYLVPALLLLLALAFWFAPPMRSMFGAIGWPASEVEVAVTTPGAASDVLTAPVAGVGTAASAAPAGVVVSEPMAVVVPVPVPPVAAASAVSAVSETVHSVPPMSAVTEASAPPTVAGMVVLRTTGNSWIEVRDAKGAVLLSRTVLPGEVVGLDGVLPMRLKAGIANVTQVTLRGEPFDLGPFTRGNVATAILK